MIKHYQTGIIILLFILSSGCKSTAPILDSEIQSMAISGDAEAQFEMAHFYFKSNKYDDALPWLEKAANQGNMKARYHLSQRFPDRGFECDMNCLKKAAEDGSSDAQYRLGGTYLNSDQGNQKDLSLAYKWLLLSKDGEGETHPGQVGIFQLIKYHKISHFEISKGQKLAKEHVGKYGISKCMY